jgi:colanic acid biosynthesis glycosyl transferase WcaI
VNTNAASPETVDPESRAEAQITLGMLNAVEENSVLTQRSLARELGIALGLANVLAAAERLRESKITFLFVGAGAERDALIEQAAQRQLPNVRFVPMQPKEAMGGIWSLCDVALVHLKDSPAFAEVIPSKIFEAMAMGLPILLVSPPGEASAILTEDEAGLWVPAGRPEALAAAAATLRADGERRAAFAARSLAAARRHTREHQAKSFIAALEAAADMRGDLSNSNSGPRSNMPMNCTTEM